jgi:hypothetical protein
MHKMQLKAFPGAQREHVTIELWMDDKPLGHIYLDAATLEDHIHKLAGHRSQLKEELPQELAPGSRLEALVDPVWRVPEQRSSRYPRAPVTSRAARRTAPSAQNRTAVAERQSTSPPCRSSASTRRVQLARRAISLRVWLTILRSTIGSTCFLRFTQSAPRSRYLMSRLHGGLLHAIEMRMAGLTPPFRTGLTGIAVPRPHVASSPSAGGRGTGSLRSHFVDTAAPRDRRTAVW